MRTSITSNHNTDDHPSGRVVLSTKRNVSAKVNALAGYRVDAMFALSKISVVHTDNLDGFGATS